MHLLFMFSSFWVAKRRVFIFSFDIFECLGEFYGLVFIFDWISFLFLRVVSLISRVVMFYSIFYIGGLSSSRFFILLLIFVVSMFFLIFRGNLIFIMLGWDGLGVISFALVIYYQNEISLKSGLITIFINRLGDAAMLFFICLYFIFSINYFSLGLDCNWNLGIFLFLLGCFTKSAQFPFISWLPAAMTAPTPISSLVHSSTLVTAGVYLLIRINLFFYMEELFIISKILGLITIGSGGIIALMEPDFKKIIAFSTLSQLGLIVFVLSYGEWELRFFHLLTHAIFKSFLFIVVGCVIFIAYGNQDSRFMGVSLISSWLKNILIGFACLNLRGFPLTIGFLSKDVILESFIIFRNEILLGSLFFLFCCFTVGYRIKIYFMSVFIIKMGNGLLFNYKFGGSLRGIFFLFSFLICWGLILEELVIFDEIFVGERDAKILDFIIILIGIFFYKGFIYSTKFRLSYSIVDFFWFGWFYLCSSYAFKTIRLTLNIIISYFTNFFSVSMFNFEYSSLSFLGKSDLKNSFYLVNKNFLLMRFIFVNLFYLLFFFILY